MFRVRGPVLIVFFGLMSIGGLLLAVDAGGAGTFFFASPLGVVYLFLAAATFLVELIFAVRRAIDRAASKRNELSGTRT